jgi:hypothetical protein
MYDDYNGDADINPKICPLSQVQRPVLKRGGQGGFEALLNPPKSPFAKGGLAAHNIP